MSDTIITGSCPPFVVSRDTFCAECNTVHDFEQCPKCLSWISFGYGLAGGDVGSYSYCKNPDCDWFRKVHDNED